MSIQPIPSGNSPSSGIPDSPTVTGVKEVMTRSGTMRSGDSCRRVSEEGSERESRHLRQSVQGPFAGLSCGH
jgi:hypothetical protein